MKLEDFSKVSTWLFSKNLDDRKWENFWMLVCWCGMTILWIKVRFVADYTIKQVWLPRMSSSSQIRAGFPPHRVLINHSWLQNDGDGCDAELKKLKMEVNKVLWHRDVSHWTSLCFHISPFNKFCTFVTEAQTTKTQNDSDGELSLSVTKTHTGRNKN